MLQTVKENMAGRVNPDLQKERNTATFDPDQLTFVLDGGEKFTKRRRYIGKYARTTCTVVVTDFESKSKMCFNTKQNNLFGKTQYLRKK